MFPVHLLRQHHHFQLVLSFSLLLLTSCKSNELQFQSLSKLKTSLQESNTTIFQTWVENNVTSICSNFTGVFCDSNGLITETQLSGQNLTGTVPFDAICEIQSLKKLSLGSNFLYGSVSSHLNNCSSLQYLDLGFNSFNGKFPYLSNLVNLKLLNLNNSGFSGNFPWKMLQNFTELTFLSLGDNPFDQTVSFPIEVIKLEKLNWLYLSNCSIYGQMPESIGNLTHLENFELSANHLSGNIPATISKLGNLWQLELYSNNLTGKLPMGFRNLTNLINFDASSKSIYIR